MQGLKRSEKTIKLKFKKRVVILKFLEPTIMQLIEYGNIIEDIQGMEENEQDLIMDNYYNAVKVIINDIQKNDFLSNPLKILEALNKLIKGDQDKIKEKSNENSNEGFLPATLDFFAQRYGTDPVSIMEKFTLKQLELFGKGAEWNTNIQNNEEKKNVRILLEVDSQNGNILEKDREKAKNDREFLKNRGFLPK